jgi:hypothetical protein
MVMGMLAVRNLFGETHDLWAVDQQGEYLEELRADSNSIPKLDVRTLASTQPLRPTLLPTQQAYDPR